MHLPFIPKRSTGRTTGTGGGRLVLAQLVLLEHETQRVFEPRHRQPASWVPVAAAAEATVDALVGAQSAHAWSSARIILSLDSISSAVPGKNNYFFQPVDSLCLACETTTHRPSFVTRLDG